MKLIKADDWPELGDVKPIDWSDAVDVHREAPARTTLAKPATGGQDSELENLRQALTDAEARHRRELVSKVEQAQREAADAHRRSDEAALAELSASLGHTAAEALDRVGAAEQLALLLCETALARVFSDPAAQQDLVARAIRRQVEQLRADLVLSVCVSIDDFPDPSHVKRLQQTLGNSFEIKRDPRLAAGCCKIDLRLGHIDLSLPAHWNTLQSELRRLAGLEKSA